MDLVPAIALAVTLGISAVTDLGTRRIPNLLTGSAAAVAVGLSAFGASTALPEALAVATMLTLPLGALAITRPDGFGMGDVKLIGVMALFLGWGVWVPLVAGLGAATFFGVAVAAARRSGWDPVALPLAPFLAIATVPSLALWHL